MIFGDGKQTRDFIYVADVASGIYKALITNNINTIYNISTQTETSINQLISNFSSIVDREIHLEYLPVREGDIYRSTLSNQRAILNLNWRPEVSLKEGISRTYKYFLSKVNNSG